MAPASAGAENSAGGRLGARVSGLAVGGPGGRLQVFARRVRDPSPDAQQSLAKPFARARRGCPGGPLVAQLDTSPGCQVEQRLALFVLERESVEQPAQQQNREK